MRINLTVVSLAIFGSILLVFLMWKGCGKKQNDAAMVDKAILDQALASKKAADSAAARFRDSLRIQSAYSDSIGQENARIRSELQLKDEALVRQGNYILQLAARVHKYPGDSSKCDSLSLEVMTWADKAQEAKDQLLLLKASNDSEITSLRNQVAVLNRRYDQYKVYCDTTISGLQGIKLPQDRSELYAVLKASTGKGYPLASFGAGLGLRDKRGAWYQVTVNNVQTIGRVVEAEYARRLSFRKNR